MKENVCRSAHTSAPKRQDHKNRFRETEQHTHAVLQGYVCRHQKRDIKPFSAQPDTRQRTAKWPGCAEKGFISLFWCRHTYPWRTACVCCSVSRNLFLWS